MQLTDHNSSIGLADSTVTKPKPIAATLALATCALLGAVSPLAQAKSDSADEWKFDTAILYYGETDRVSLVEGVISATKDFGDEHIFNGKVTFDGLTGASATGAVPQDTVQTYSRPSGNAGYAVAAGETPLDDTFKDSRVQLNAQWTQPLVTDLRGSTGVHFSKEYDYLSLGVNGSLARDFNQKNTTLSVGLSYQFDSIDPVGGTPERLGSISVLNSLSDYDLYDAYVDEDRGDNDSGNAEFDDHENHYGSRDGAQDKDTIDVLFGLTQIINRRTIMQFNYGMSVSDGYLNDPYKLVSVVNNQGTVQDTLFESRPDSRTKHNVYWQTKYAMDSGVVDLSYRFATDDWDIQSHTLESRLRYNLSDNSYIQPHLRYYQQSAAEFYQPFLLSDQPLPTYASADYRLGDMDAYTVGLKYGQKLDNGDTWAVRVEYYQQNPKNAGFAEPGQLAELDLYPSIKALIVQFNYQF
jgi:hypothetical protein